MQPRLTAAYGDDGTNHCYSGIKKRVLPWTSTLLEIKRKVENVLDCYSFCLLNRYRSGSDSVSMHSENEHGLDNIIDSISLGTTRKFKITHNATNEKKNS